MFSRESKDTAMKGILALLLSTAPFAAIFFIDFPTEKVAKIPIVNYYMQAQIVFVYCGIFSILAGFSEDYWLLRVSASMQMVQKIIKINYLVTTYAFIPGFVFAVVTNDALSFSMTKTLEIASLPLAVFLSLFIQQLILFNARTRLLE